MDLFIQAVDALVTAAALLCAYRAGVSRGPDPRWAQQMVFCACLLGLVGIAL